MPYLLIICDCRTLFPRGTQITDFQLTKGGFTGEQVDFSSPSLAHTPVNPCIVNAKPLGRNRRAEMAPCPAHALKGMMLQALSLYSGAVVSPRRYPHPPGRLRWAFPWGVAPALFQPQPSTAGTTFPGRHWPFPYPLRCAQTRSRRRGGCCRARS